MELSCILQVVHAAKRGVVLRCVLLLLLPDLMKDTACIIVQCAKPTGSAASSQLEERLLLRG